jgi:hypothetical protein
MKRKAEGDKMETGKTHQNSQPERRNADLLLGAKHSGESFARHSNFPVPASAARPSAFKSCKWLILADSASFLSNLVIKKYFFSALKISRASTPSAGILATHTQEAP